MPFVRFSRDKRGYEYVYLVDVPARQARSSRPRILYWYRTPPGLKVGRQAFDEGAQRTIEALYPDLKFDWKQIIDTPMPPPEPTPWRERRRQERAARRSLAADGPAESETAEGLIAEQEAAPQDPHALEGDEPPPASAGLVETPAAEREPQLADRQRQLARRGRRRRGFRAPPG